MKNAVLLALLFLLSLVFGLLFYFNGGELISNIKDSYYWTNSIRYNRFDSFEGKIYLDLLPRDREWQFKCRLKTYNSVELKAVELDQIPVEEAVNHQTMINKYKMLVNIYNINLRIPPADKKYTIIKFILRPPSNSQSLNIRQSTLLQNAELKSLGRSPELLHLLITGLISTVIGFVIYLYLNNRFRNILLSALLGSAAVLASIFIINTFSFRYVYSLVARRPSLYLYIFILFSQVLIGLYILLKQNATVKKKAVQEKTRHSYISKITRNAESLDFYLLAAIFVLCIIQSAYTFTNHFYIDDYIWMRKIGLGELVSAFAGPVDPSGCLPNYYRPVTLLYMQGQYRIFGNSYILYYLLRSFHLFLNCSLVYFITKRITGERFSSFCAAAAISVSMYAFSAAGWISSAFDVLMLTFILLGVSMRFKEETRGRDIKTFIILLAALASKESAVMMPFILLSVDIIFHTYKSMKRFILFHLASFITTGLYIAMRFVLWGGLGGMEDEQGYYSLANIRTLLFRIVEIFYTLFSSSGTSDIKIENVLGTIIRMTFILTILLTGIYILLFKRKEAKVGPECRLFNAGILWILFLALPILFPFTLIRLGYILLPGVGFIIGSAISVISKSDKMKKLFPAILFLLLLSLTQQAIASLRFGCQKYEPSAYFYNAKSQSIYKEWEAKLPTEARQNWLGDILKH